jgi:hypothetical protein
MITGTGSLAACSIAQDVPTIGLKINATLDIPAVYAGITGKCPSTDPFHKTMSDLSAQLRTVLYSQVHDMLEGGSLSSMIDLRQNIKDIVYNAANSTGNSVADFVDGLSTDVIACSSINSIFTEVKDAMCCNVITPLWWYVSAWYLVGWAMLCCGIPVGCYGRKRLPKGPWGPAYELELAGDGPKIIYDPKAKPERVNTTAGGKTALVGPPPKSGDAAQQLPSPSVLKNVNTKRGAKVDAAADVDGG